MTTTTRERNYKKNPHTARWLQTFHAAAYGLASDVKAEEDLLNLVPTTAPTYRPSVAQVKFISDLILQINAMDTELGEQAASYTGRMDRAQAWTQENTSRWIDRLIAKRHELRAAQFQPGATVAAAVADGRYAVEEDGVLKFFKVKNGDRPGFMFLDVQASDDWHPIRLVSRIHAVLALIAANAEEASLRYGRELGVCGDCGRTLTDETSRARGRGPICDAKH